MSRRLEDLEPETRRMCFDFLTACSAMGFDVLVTDTARTREEQTVLYAQGRTRPGKVVTNAKAGQTPHCPLHGCQSFAFDVAFRTDDGGVTWDGPWEELGAIGRSVGLEWGGDWTGFKDMPHFQRPGWKQLAQGEGRRVV